MRWGSRSPMHYAVDFGCSQDADGRSASAALSLHRLTERADAAIKIAEQSRLLIRNSGVLKGHRSRLRTNSARCCRIPSASTLLRSETGYRLINPDSVRETRRNADTPFKGPFSRNRCAHFGAAGFTRNGELLISLIPAPSRYASAESI